MKRKPVMMLMIATVFMLVSMAACSGGVPGGGSSGTPDAETSTNPQNHGGGGEEIVAEEEFAPEEGAELTVWESEEEKPFIEAIGKAFEEKYGVPVKVEVVPGGDQLSRLQTDGPAGLAADLLTMPHDHVGAAATAGLVLPNDYFEQETRERSLESAIAASSFDGMLYGYPKSVETYALFYNKELMPEAPQTWEDVIEFAKTFNDVKNNKFAIMWEFEPYYSYPFIAGYGGYVFGDNGTDPTDVGINKGNAVQGFEFLQRLKEILPLNTGDITYDVKTELFQTGKLAMNIDGPWSVGTFRDQVDFGVVPLPLFLNEQHPVSFSGVKSFYVNAYTKYPQAAKRFAVFATNKENALKNYEMTGVIPANKEAGEDPKIANDPITSGFFEQFQHSHPMPSIPEMRHVWDPLKGAFALVWNEGADPEETLNDAAATIQEKIRSNEE